MTRPYRLTLRLSRGFPLGLTVQPTASKRPCLKMPKSARMASLRALSLSPTESAHSAIQSFRTEIPPELRHAWNLLFVSAAWPRGTLVRIRIGSIADSHFSGRESFPVSIPFIGRRLHMTSVGFTSGADDTIIVDVLGCPRLVPEPLLRIKKLGRAAAAAVILLTRPRLIGSALTGGIRTAARQIRVVLAVSAMSSPKWPPYSEWVRLFETGPPEGTSPPRANPAGPAKLSAVVFGSREPSHEGLGATLESLADNYLRHHVIDSAATDPAREIQAVLQSDDSDYFVVLQAGEVLSRHIASTVAAAIRDFGRVAILYADEDERTAARERRNPFFKPVATRMLMLSGILTRGLWVLRRDILVSGSAEACRWPETLRLDRWLRLSEQGEDRAACRLPYVLVHRCPDTKCAPTVALKRVVTDHLARQNLTMEVDARRFPLVVKPSLLHGHEPAVALVIPSSLRNPQTIDCIASVLAGTDYPKLDILVVVSQQQPPDHLQLASARKLLSDNRVHLLHFPSNSFNYSAANNFAASHTDVPFLCLLNDDVAPISPDWLRLMIGHFADPSVGIVGAKLYYANQTVQHAGVIMGLNGICEHAWRFLPRYAGGAHERANLDQEMSAVTGACLAIRRSVFDEIGGLDEGFPISYNDIDLCMKARSRGYRVMLSAHSELFHYESVSLKRHYSNEAEGEAIKYRRKFLARWSEICANDPFHSPNLCLQAGNEWLPAFPPRTDWNRLIDFQLGHRPVVANPLVSKSG